MASGYGFGKMRQCKGRACLTLVEFRGVNQGDGKPSPYITFGYRRIWTPSLFFNKRFEALPVELMDRLSCLVAGSEWPHLHPIDFTARFLACN